jgi:hypothetical protein
VQLNSPANDWAALDGALSDLAASGSVEVRADGAWLAELATLHFELRVERKNPLVPLWSDERNLTRRKRSRASFSRHAICALDETRSFSGLGNSAALLTTSNERALERLLHQLDLYRGPLATDTNHALYCGAPERWLESIAQKIPQKLDALRDTRHFYSRFPRSQPVIEVCSICSASRARAAWS